VSVWIELPPNSGNRDKCRAKCLTLVFDISSVVDARGVRLVDQHCMPFLPNIKDFECSSGGDEEQQRCSTSALLHKLFLHLLPIRLLPGLGRPDLDGHEKFAKGVASTFAGGHLDQGVKIVLKQKLRRAWVRQPIVVESHPSHRKEGRSKIKLGGYSFVNTSGLQLATRLSASMCCHASSSTDMHPRVTRE
jgi:hypothetical protein